MVDLAGQSEAISARAIAEKYGLPAAMLTNVLKALAAAGLISSTRGSKGGYTLSGDPAAIRLGEMIEAIEGPVRLTQCCQDPSEADAEACDIAAQCPTREPIRKVQVLLQDFLGQVSLADLAADTVQIRLQIPKTNAVGPEMACG
jgi:Rrf2 family protein